MSFDKERAIAAQNAATAAATLLAGQPVTMEEFEEVRASIFTHTLGLAGLGEMAGYEDEDTGRSSRSSGGRSGGRSSYGGGRGSTSRGSDEDLSEFELRSGKHRGKTLAEIADEDFEYLEWAAENLKNDFARKRIEQFLKQSA